MKKTLMGGLVALVVLASACGSEPAPAPTEVPAATEMPQPTPTPVPTPTRVLAPTPTATAGPAPVTIRTSRRAERAADFQLDLLSGGELNLSDLQGKVVVLNFWASWCPPCRAEMPSFESIYQEYSDRGVVFVGVAVSDTEDEAREFAEKVGVTYPIGLDSGQIAVTYRISAMPTTYFIDEDGSISKRIQGPANEGALRFFLDSRVQ